MRNPLLAILAALSLSSPAFAYPPSHHGGPPHRPPPREWRDYRPALADVTVVNPLPIAVMISADGFGARLVQPGGYTVFMNAPFGPLRVSATRRSGEWIDESVVSVRQEGARWQVRTPSVGLLHVDSDQGIPLRVLVDRVEQVCLSPYQAQTLQLPVGEHRVSVVDGRGRTYVDTWVVVDPFYDSWATANAPSYADRYDDRGRDDDWRRDDGHHDDGHRDDGHRGPPGR